MWLTIELPPLPPGVTIDIGELVDLPEDRDAWIADALAQPRPSGATFRRTATDVLTHDVGWPITRLVVEVTHPGGAVELRVVWFFELLVRGALIRARVAPDARQHWDVEHVTAALRAAPIRLHGREPVAIAELFE